jgi:peptide/nickel transport system substrate-binding protein
VAALTVLALCACDAGREPLHSRRDPGALVVAQAADIIALDPIRVTDTESIEVSELIYEGLVGWKAGTTDIEPRLADSWQVSPDGLVWTFHLHAHVMFHDGTPFDANAVVFSFNRLLDKKNPSYLPESEGTLYWRFLLKDVREVVAKDPLTVEIHTGRSYSPLLADLCEFPMVSPPAAAQRGDSFKIHPVGTGPFLFENWTPGEQVVVRRFEAYWGTRPGLDRIVFQVVVDARQRLIDLESGSVDLATAILPDEQPFVELHPDLHLHHTPGDDVSYLAFNTQHPPFDDVRVRRAANLAINKTPIVKLAYQGRAIPADGPLPPTSWAYHSPATTYPFDADKAKKLLAEAVAAGRFDPNKTYTLYAPTTPRAYLPQPERIARLLQAALEQVGIHTELVLQPINDHRADVEVGKHDMAVFGWIGDTGDPDNFLYVLFHSDNAQATGAQNVAFYKDPEVDKLLIAAQATADEKTRSAIYASVQDKLALDAPWVPIAHSELVVAGRAEIEHVILSPTGHPVYSLIRRTEVKER